MTKGFEVGLTITRPFINDIIVRGVIDTYLLKYYDAMNKTTVKRYDLSKFELVDTDITIKSGDIHSSNTFNIRLKDKDSFIIEPFVIPIRITTKEEVPVSNIRDRMYLVIKSQKLVSASFNVGLERINSFYQPMLNIYPKFDLPVNLNITLQKDLVITIDYDPSLISAYNIQNGIAFLELPKDTIVTNDKNITILGNSLISNSNIQIQFPDVNKVQLGKEYLIPIKITNAQNAFVSETNGVKFLVLKPLLNNIDVTNSGLSGMTIDRSTMNRIWSV